MDDTHILVVLRASGGKAVRQAAELAAKVHGVESWMPFEQWREMQVHEHARHKVNGNHEEVPAWTPARSQNSGAQFTPGAVAFSSSTGTNGTGSKGSTVSSSAPVENRNAPADQRTPS